MSGNRKALFITPVIPRKGGIGIQQRAYRNLHLLTMRFSVDIIVVTSQQPDLTPLDLKLANASWIQRSYKNLPDWALSIPFLQVINRLWWHLISQTTAKMHLSGLTVGTGDPPAGYYDIVFCFRLASALVPVALARRGLPKPGSMVIDLDDIESKAKQRGLMVTGRARGWQKFVSEKLDIYFANKRELQALKTFDDVWVCSDEDRKELAAVAGGRARILTMPNTVYLPRTLESARKQSILFLGAMSYYPNEDAVTYFCREILPRVTEVLGTDLEFLIAGNMPSESILALQKINGVKVIGWVENVAKLYQTATIVIVPIRFGGGTRIKVLEAMAYGRMVISTSVGCEGLGARTDEELVVADSPSEFADAVVKYLQDSSARERIEDNARRFVLSNFEFSSALEKFEKFYSIDSIG